MMDFRGYLLGVWCFFCLSVTAQPVEQLKWRTLDLRDGIPQATFEGALLQDRFGRLWIGTDRGLCVHDGRNTRTFNAETGDPESLTEVNIQSLYEDRDGMIWIGMWNGGLAVYNPASNKFRRILPTSYGGRLPVRRIWNVWEDDHSHMWIVSEEGLVRYDPGLDTFYHFYPQFEDEGLADYRPRIMRALIPHPFSPQTLLVASANGLLEFDLTSERFSQIPMPYSSRQELGWRLQRYLVVDLHHDGDSTIWCTTWAGGLMKYHIPSRSWARYYLPNVPHTEDIGYDIEPTAHRQSGFWYANRSGLYVVDTASQSFIPIPHIPGDSTSIAPGSIYDVLCLGDSTFAVYGSGGLNICTNCNASADDPPHYAPYLSEIFCNHERLEPDSSTLFLKTLFLEPDQNTIRFTVAYPEYADPASVRYRFKLEGHDANWIETGLSEVTYEGLRGGKYVLHYQASTANQHWRDGLTTPVVQIRIPLWKHPLVMGSAIFFLLAVVLGLHRYRMHLLSREKTREAEYNQRVAALEMTVLRAQMNPHFLFNSLNSIKNYILKEKTDEASHYLTKFSQLMRAVLQNSRTAFISLQDELKALALYIELEALRFEGEFTWTISTDPALASDSLFVPPLLIQPYVENAIRHGLLEKESGERTLALFICPAGPDKILIVIEDNGIGRQRSAQLQKKMQRNRSYGMQITSDRIALISRTLGVDARVHVEDLTHTDGSPAGTRVQIEIPKLTAPVMTGVRSDANEILPSYAEDHSD